MKMNGWWMKLKWGPKDKQHSYLSVRRTEYPHIFSFHFCLSSYMLIANQAVTLGNFQADFHSALKFENPIANEDKCRKIKKFNWNSLFHTTFTLMCQRANNTHNNCTRVSHRNKSHGKYVHAISDCYIAYFIDYSAHMKWCLWSIRIE